MIDVKAYNGTDGELFTSSTADVTPPTPLVNISCDAAGTGATCNTTWGPVQGVVASGTLIIEDLNFTDGSDKAGIQMQIAVPADEPPGAKSMDIVLFASPA